MWPVSHTFPTAFSLVTHLTDPVAGGIKPVPSWGPGFPPHQVFQSFVFQTVFQGAPWCRDNPGLVGRKIYLVGCISLRKKKKKHKTFHIHKLNYYELVHALAGSWAWSLRPISPTTSPPVLVSPSSRASLALWGALPAVGTVYPGLCRTLLTASRHGWGRSQPQCPPHCGLSISTALALQGLAPSG